MTGAGIADLRDRLERFDSTDLGALAVFLAVLYVVTDGSLESIAVVLGFVLVSPVFERVLETAAVSDTTTGFLLGSIVGVLGIGAIVFDGSVWIGAVVFAVGCWIVLDTIYESQYGDPTETEPEDDDITEAEMYTLMGHGMWVLEELREASRPLTAEELRTRTGLTEDELEDVLEMTRENGTVERVGTGYVANEDELGGVAFVRGIVRSVGGRILRPFRLFRPSR